jgi:hypothetical protein
MKSMPRPNEENKALAEQLRAIAAVETLAGSSTVAAEFLLRAEALEAGRRFFSAPPDRTKSS